MTRLHTIANTVIRLVAVVSLCMMSTTGERGACLIAKGLHTMGVNISVAEQVCTSDRSTRHVASATGVMFSGSCKMVCDMSKFSAGILASIADMLDDVKTNREASWQANREVQTEQDSTTVAALARVPTFTSKRDRINKTQKNSVHTRTQNYFNALLYALLRNYTARSEVGVWEHAVWDGGIHIRGNIDGNAVIPMMVGGFYKGV